LFVVAALAAGVIDARLRATNAARMRLFIEILHPPSGEMSGFDGYARGG
jgi:hypothetical protein